MKIRIVGVQHLYGEKSKKTGKPYDFCVLHSLSCVYEGIENPGYSIRGFRVEPIMCDTSIALDIPVPCLANLCFDRFGRVEDIEIYEVFETV